MVAFEVLNPVLRSRGAVDNTGMDLFKDEGFNTKFKELFEGEPTGSIEFPSLTYAMEKISTPEEKIHKLEELIQNKKKMNPLSYFYNCSAEYINSIDTDLYDQINTVIPKPPKRQTQSEISSDLFWLLTSHGWNYDTFISRS